MTNEPTATITLNNGGEMPLLGLGVFQSQAGLEVIRAFGWALAAGYRLIDTAASYGNEAGVGAAVRQISTIPKSANENRIRANGELFDFTLSEEEIALIDGLDTGTRIGPDPDNFSF